MPVIEVCSAAGCKSATAEPGADESTLEYEISRSHVSGARDGVGTGGENGCESVPSSQCEEATKDESSVDVFDESR